MKRILAFIAIAVTLCAFVLMSLVLILKIDIIIPIIMFIVGFIMLLIIKKLPEPDDQNDGTEVMGAADDADLNAISEVEDEKRKNQE